MTRDLSRLLRPRSVALFGGVWAENVIAQLLKSGFAGKIWPVHPTRASILGVPCVADLADLPEPPDAAFVGVNRALSVEIVAKLAAMGAGGAICFAAGFRETEAEGTGGAALQERLVAAAGAMPILGPNCYGLINYLDNAALWPDQHGGALVARGAAFVSQSSNVAVNVTMQRRGLSLAYVMTAGNQAQTGLADLAQAALEDSRVSAVGLYIEGFGDIRAFEAMARRARALGKPVVALKAGRTAASQAATLTHTASLAGGAAAASAFLARCGVVEVGSLAVLLETLKLFDLGGPLAGPDIASVSCSGGEASLMADLAGAPIRFRPFSDTGKRAVSAVLGPLVTVANPLDYNTFIWGDAARMSDAFAAVAADGFDLSAFVLDLPRPDRCDRSSYRCAVEAILAARARTGARVAVVASMAEGLDEADCAAFAAGGVAPLLGMEEALAAIGAAIRAGAPAEAAPALIGFAAGPGRMLDEAEAKAALAAHGLRVPRAVTAADPAALVAAAAALRPPLALKALGLAHKTEAGGVVLGLGDLAALRAAAERMAGLGAGLMAEEMAPPGAAELLIGVARDPTGLMALTLAAGGVEAELLRDSVTLILPATRAEIGAALDGLRIGAKLRGWRGRPAADREAALDAVEAVARYAASAAGRLIELDVNPLIAGPAGAVAVDALIRLGE